MTDRESRYPGRYRAVMDANDVANMQASNQFSITLVRDDDPIEPGTPYNKASVLPDEVAALLGVHSDDVTPADAFLQIARELGRIGEEVGNAATTAELQETADIAKMTADELLEHRDNTENPHEVTCAQVGAAPAGYGLGEFAATGVTDCNELTKNGWYSTTADALNRPGHDECVIFVISNGTLIYQFGSDRFVERTLPLTRMYNGSYWTEWKDFQNILYEELDSSIGDDNNKIGMLFYTYLTAHLYSFGLLEDSIDENGDVIGAQPVAVSREEFQSTIGDIETALDGIIAIQTELIGGDGV